MIDYDYSIVFRPYSFHRRLGSKHHSQKRTAVLNPKLARLRMKNTRSESLDSF